MWTNDTTQTTWQARSDVVTVRRGITVARATKRETVDNKQVTQYGFRSQHSEQYYPINERVLEPYTGDRAKCNTKTMAPAINFRRNQKME